MSFTANPANVAAAGQPVTLSWEITGSVTSLEIDNGVGAITGTSAIVYPTGPTTYTLTAGNASGSSDATAAVSIGGGGPVAEDGLPPSGTFGVSLTQTDFQSDAGSDITSPSDPRIIRVAPNSTFYALVSYSDPGGVAGVRIRLANSSPAGFGADLVQGQDVKGFTLNGEVTGCVLDGTQVAVTCIYEIAVGNIGNITTLPGAGREFAYVLRTNVTDAAGHESDSPPRGYVIVGGSGGGTPTTPPPTDPDPDTNSTPSADFTFQQQAGTLTVAFSGKTSSDPDGDSLKYSWDFGDGSSAGTRDFRRNYTSAGTKQVTLTVTDPDGAKNSVTKPVQVVAPSDDGDDNGGGDDGSGGDNDGPTAPTITSFTANPVSITSGQSSTLSWNITGTVTSLNIDQGVGNVTGTTSKVVNPSATTIYTLTASNGSATTTKTATVTVGSGGTPPPVAPTINSFTASPESISSGDDSTLAWSISGTVTSLSIDNGVGDVTGAASKSVSPTTTTTYTLTASNGASSAKSTVTVTVTSDQPISNRDRTASLLGTWRFTYQIISQFTDVFTLTRVVEIDGDYLAVGTDQYGDSVIAAYDPALSDYGYYLFDGSEYEYSGLDHNFYFKYNSANSVSGIYYFYDRFEEGFSNEYPFTSQRTSSANASNNSNHTMSEAELNRVSELYNLAREKLSASAANKSRGVLSMQEADRIRNRYEVERNEVK